MPRLCVSLVAVAGLLALLATSQRTKTWTALEEAPHKGSVASLERAMNLQEVPASSFSSLPGMRCFRSELMI